MHNVDKVESIDNTKDHHLLWFGNQWFPLPYNHRITALLFQFDPSVWLIEMNNFFRIPID